VRPSDASRLVLDDPRRPSRPRCVFAGLVSWGRRLLARVAPAFDVVALVGGGRPESVAWSVRNYPAPEAIAGIMRDAGLADVTWTGISGGIVTLHVGTVPPAA